MGLIDKDETIEAIEVYAHELACIFGNPEEANRALAVKNIIDDQPEVAAAPVVRCKDCRYWERFNNTSLGTCYHGIYAGSNLGTPENHFCASAARMDGGEGE